VTDRIDKSGRYSLQFLWQAILFCFLLAALAGVLFRLGMIMPLYPEFSLQNVRHAHSHLMFFGWAGALPLYIFLKRIRSIAGDTVRGFREMYTALWGMLLFGLLSFPSFLLYGYHPVTIGGFSLPLSVIFSGMVMICWYLFIGGYLAARNEIVEEDRNMWFEAALVMLVVSSLGAWGVAVAQAFDLAAALIGKGLTHFFLASFTEGWVVLAAVGILDEALDIPDSRYPVSPGILAAALLLAAPLTFPYGISESLLTPLMLGTARAAGLVLGCALGVIAYTMLNSWNSGPKIWVWPMALLLVKAGMQVFASVIPSGFWLSDFALRILYLHVLLLGAFTLAGLAYLHAEYNLAVRSYTGVALSIVMVLLSLLLLTRLWPLAWGGIWVYYAVAAAAVLPVITVSVEWANLRTGSTLNTE